MIARYKINPDGSITCRCCGRTSHNPGDRKNLYCGMCNVFHRDVLTVWVLFDHPRDLPGSFVVRGQDLVNGEIVHHRTCFEFDSAEEARAELARMGLTKIDREPGDDPVIMESWI